MSTTSSAPTRSRIPGIIAASAVVLVAGISAWWWLGPNANTCDPDVLRRGIDAVNEQRAEHPAVLLWAYPDLELAITTSVPTSPQIGPFEDGIFVRVTMRTIELPGGPTLSTSSSPQRDQQLAAWLDAQLRGPVDREQRVVAIVAEADARARVLADIADALRSRDIEVVVVVRGEDGQIGGEPIACLPDDEAPTHGFQSIDGRLELVVIDLNTPNIVSAPHDSALPEIERWAAGIADREATLVYIDLHGFTAQQLVDVQVALRGRSCDPLDLLSGVEAPECHLVRVGLDCAGPAEKLLREAVKVDRG